MASLKRTNQTASTLTLTLSDPLRQILRANIGVEGSSLTVDGLEFIAVQQTKASDQLAFTFEAAGVANLRLLLGPTTTTDSVNLSSWVGSLVAQVPGLAFVAQQDPLAAAVSMGVGTSTDTQEDYWTAIQRVVTSGGWRCFEVNNTIYLGSDEWFATGPVVATISEFTQGVQTIDFWDRNRHRHVWFVGCSAWSRNLYQRHGGHGWTAVAGAGLPAQRLPSTVHSDTLCPDDPVRCD